MAVDAAVGLLDGVPVEASFAGGGVVVKGLVVVAPGFGEVVTAELADTLFKRKNLEKLGSQGFAPAHSVRPGSDFL